MLLKEFFGPAIKVGNKLLSNKSSEEENELFWYILDHDKLHKDYILPLAKKIKNQHKKGKFNKEQCVAEFMPMVEKGCLEFYKNKKLHGKLGKEFPRKLRDELCEKLFDHFYEDIIKNQYTLGM